MKVYDRSFKSLACPILVSRVLRVPGPSAQGDTIGNVADLGKARMYAVVGKKSLTLSWPQA